MQTIRIGERLIGDNQPPFVIAEMSGNHNQSLERALELVHAAKRSGADALKLQTYTADTLTIKSENRDFFVSDENSRWRGSYLYDLYESAYTPWEWHKTIFDEARNLDLICFSSAFDETAVDFLEKLDVPAYKIASFENSHLRLVEMIAKTGKPLIISTGLATLDEISETVECARSNGCKDLVLLKCTSSYPASPSNANLRTMHDLKKRFDCLVGFSDHSLGIGSAVGAVAIGASVIEKHFTISKSEESVDSFFSLSEQQFKNLVDECKSAWDSLGEVYYGPTPEEMPSIKFRRSIYAVQNIMKGEILSPKNLRVIRPGFGLHPRYFNELLGKTSVRDVNKGEAIDQSFLV